MTNHTCKSKCIYISQMSSATAIDFKIQPLWGKSEKKIWVFGFKMKYVGHEIKSLVAEGL